MDRALKAIHDAIADTMKESADLQVEARQLGEKIEKKESELKKLRETLTFLVGTNREG